MIAHSEQARTDGEISAIAALARETSDGIGDEFGRRLDRGRPHLW